MSGQEDCGCKPYCEDHGRDEINTASIDREFCEECAINGWSGELCHPDPHFVHLNGGDEANEFVRWREIAALIAAAEREQPKAVVDESTVREWIDRHDLGGCGSYTDMFCAFTDAASFAAAPAERPLADRDNPWYAAITDACAVNHMGWDDSDAYGSLRALIGRECEMSLDPSISSAAQALVDSGKPVAAMLAAKEPK